MASRVRNVSGGALTLPLPYSRILAPGQSISVLEDPDVVIGMFGGFEAISGSLEVRQEPSTSVLQTVTLVARTGGSDSSGVGSITSPFASVERLLAAAPRVIPFGYRFILDCTGVTTSKSGGLYLPPFESNDIARFNFSATHNAFFQESPVVLRATPTVFDTIAVGELSSQTSDAVTAQRTLVTTKSYTLNQLKGKFVVGATIGQVGTIASNTAGPNSSIEITSAFNFTAPITIVDPSAVIHNSSASSSEGALNMDSVSCPVTLQGLKLTHANSSASVASLISEGFTRAAQITLCDMAGVNFAGASRASTPSFNSCYFRAAKSATFSGTGLVLSNGFLESLTPDFRGVGSGYDSGFLQSCIFRSCAPVGGSSIPAVDSTSMFVQNTKVESGSSHGIQVNPKAAWQLQTTAVRGNAGSGVRMNGGRLDATTTRTTPGTTNTGFGLEALDGAHATITSTVDLTGTAGDLKVGSNAAVSWATFRGGASPITEVDATVHLARVVQP